MKRLDTLYPGRVEPDSSDYPGGSFKDKSSGTSNDGTPIADAERLNNIWGALLAILDYAGLAPNDVTEKTSASQIVDAIFKSEVISGSALATGAVLSSKLADSSVQNAKIATTAVTESKIDSGAIVNRHLTNDCVESANIQAGSVVNSTIATGAVTNTKLGSDLQLNKISGGTLYIGSGATTVLLDQFKMMLGPSSGVNTALYKTGIDCYSANTPGEKSYHFRPAIYEISTELNAGSSDTLNTGSASSHVHAIGTEYYPASSIETDIPNDAHILYSTISYSILGTSGVRKQIGVPCKITAEKGSTTLGIIQLSIYNVETSGSFLAIDFNYDVNLSIFFDGSGL